MTGPLLGILVLLTGLTSLAGTTPPSHILTFEDRVKAQEAIERVYYSHQIGATDSFEEAIPRAVLERKVLTYLRLSAALEAYWNTPVTAASLRHELERISARSRLPERLHEIFAALGNDSVLIQECLARPALVDRLSRQLFSTDTRIHGAVGNAAAALRDSIAANEATLDVEQAHGKLIDYLRNDSGPAKSLIDRDMHASEGHDGAQSFTSLSPVEFDAIRKTLPANVGGVSPVVEEPDAFLFRRLLHAEVGHLQVKEYRFEKTSWDRWSKRYVDALVADSVPAVASSVQDLGALGAGSYSNAGCQEEFGWDNGSLDDIPEARAMQHNAVWTGSALLVWGGWNGGVLGSGGKYDPLTDTWTPISRVGAPVPRVWHTAVWTGTEMVIWGGSDKNYNQLSTGGRYSPATDSWRTTATIGKPSGRSAHSAVWTGSKMLIFGGDTRDPHGNGGLTNTGGIYDPIADVWQTMPTINAPQARAYHSGVWTGTQMIVWGGQVFGGYVSTGGRFDPATNSWSPTSNVGAPALRTGPTAVWTGSRMIVWGGIGAGNVKLNTGGRYDPSSDSWSPTSNLGAPSPRVDHSAIWTGQEMIIWGGDIAVTGYSYTNTGARYNPLTDSWTPTSLLNAASPRSQAAFVWTGSLMIIWGGYDYGVPETGAKYDPSTDSWASMTTGIAPPGRERHTAVWTGSLMIVWGGRNNGTFYNGGGRYDPTLDTWSPTSETNSPLGRYEHTAIWTGTDMIVWGGTAADGSYLGSGGKYNLMDDSWTPTSLLSAPVARTGHTGVWSGSEVLIWGGHTGQWLGTGGRYRPDTDSWLPITSSNAPTPRTGHSGIWTGSKLLVWGGYDGTSPFLVTGGIYDPSSDSWTQMSITNAPLPRLAQTAIWTGTQMVIWGGYQGTSIYTFLDSGGRFDPETNIWAPATLNAAPTMRAYHSAVWTGSRMVVWGGINLSGYFDTGGRYDPSTDSWDATSLIGAASARNEHTAIVASPLMIVWGGHAGHVMRDGGALHLALSPDADGDGFRLCSGDCDDSRPTVHSGALQICGDGLNNDCDHPNWPSLTGTNEIDDDGDTFSECQNDCDDSRSLDHPGVTEFCDGHDNNCDGDIDEGFDPDGDGSTSCEGDCVEDDPRIYPAAPQVCDGINNDCLASGWPSVLGTNELDDDGDGFSECQADCDDNDPSIYSGAPEINDARDNQCPGNAGAGLRDEVAGDAGFTEASPSTNFCWTPQSGATSYLVDRADDPIFSTNCQAFPSATTNCVSDTSTPAPSRCYYYLVRAASPNGGSWGESSSGAERTTVCTSSTVSFQFVDTLGDDVPAVALYDFFTNAVAPQNSYIFFEVTGSPSGGAWCSERADFYRNNYLSLSSNAATLMSGSWNKWHRTTGGSWSGPVTDGFLNYFGSDCYEPWSWCSEYGLGNLLLDARPAGPNHCEITDDNSGCNGGTWRLTIRVAPDRFSACGF